MRPSRDNLKNIPENERKYKCLICYTASIPTEYVIGGKCPECGSDQLIIQCPKDHCNCHEERVETVAYCDICGGACCPICGSHDVVQISRVTGLVRVSTFLSQKFIRRRWMEHGKEARVC